MTDPNPNFLRDAFDQALGKDIDAGIAEQLALAEAEPENPKPYCALGTFFHMQGRIDEAKMMYRHALRLDADYALAHQYLGQLLAAREEFTEAWKHAREAARLGNTILVDVLRNFQAPGWRSGEEGEPKRE